MEDDFFGDVLNGVGKIVVDLFEWGFGWVGGDVEVCGEVGVGYGLVVEVVEVIEVEMEGVVVVEIE